MSQTTEPPARKPRLALLIVTGLGLGSLPKAPGSWGSLSAALLVWALDRFLPAARGFTPLQRNGYGPISFAAALLLLILVSAAVGIWASGRMENYLHARDPQVIVIDEICGQALTYLPGAFWPLGWKYLLLGFILFRGFDIGKPFPARQAERLPGGWGVMADDWVAGIYAALGLWLAHALGL